MRRPAPRPLKIALGAAVAGAQPATLLAAVQGVWVEVVGLVLAAEAEPTSERDGTLTATCTSAAWAHELELLAPDLMTRLNARIGSGAPWQVEGLRFRVGSPPNQG